MSARTRKTLAICPCAALVLSAACLFADPIPAQTGNDIICYGPAYTYQHDLRQNGIDENLTISGYPGFIEETGTAYASYFTDTARYSTGSAVFEYNFVAQPGALIGDATVSTRAFILLNSGTITGHHRADDGPWTQFFSVSNSGDYRLEHTFENVNASRLTVRYTVDRTASPHEAYVQLFRSSNPQPNQPGDYAFTFTTSLTTDPDCHAADINNDFFIDIADLAAIAQTFNQTGENLPADINKDGTCDLLDLQLLAQSWLQPSYQTSTN